MSLKLQSMHIMLSTVQDKTPFGERMFNGTASSLNGRGYTVAGKTGSAEYNESGASHSWFVGYSNVDNPDIVVSVIVEDGGTGSEAAVPIAADVFDAYYFD